MSITPMKAPSAALAAAPRAGARRGSARFLTCLLVLLAAAGGREWTAQRLGAHFRKEPLPLKKALVTLIDTPRLAPRYVLNRELTDKLPPMTEDMLESLGTREYAQFYVTDTAAPLGSRTRIACVFVTYYTGQPDMVPHVPDECYIAGGYDSLGAQNLNLNVAGVRATDNQLPVRLMRFEGRRRGFGESPQLNVAYFFHANGKYTTTRDGVRWSMVRNIAQKYAYYTKIEVTFSNESLENADAEATAVALPPLLAQLMPILLEDHIDLPTFQAAGHSKSE
jgi:hypothetical protein